MQVPNRFTRIAAVMAATVLFAACKSTPLTQAQNPGDTGLQPLPSTETRPAPPAQPAPPQPAKPAASFLRPAPGRTIAAFDGNRNKGIDIAGNPGDSIVASADGRVIYTGNSLGNYGNIVVVKHSDTYVTAYAHARTIVVKENEIVRQGQKIAEIGNSGADRVKLHFEIRKQGTPVDPEPYLAGELH
jgi:lipoprotein NlpD